MQLDINYFEDYFQIASRENLRKQLKTIIKKFNIAKIINAINYFVFCDKKLLTINKIKKSTMQLSKYNFVNIEKQFSNKFWLLIFVHSKLLHIHLYFCCIYIFDKQNVHNLISVFNHHTWFRKNSKLHNLIKDIFVTYSFKNFENRIKIEH